MMPGHEETVAAANAAIRLGAVVVPPPGTVIEFIAIFGRETLTSVVLDGPRRNVDLHMSIWARLGRISDAVPVRACDECWAFLDKIVRVVSVPEDVPSFEEWEVLGP
jgi:hypothetical protein